MKLPSQLHVNFSDKDIYFQQNIQLCQYNRTSPSGSSCHFIPLPYTKENLICKLQDTMLFIVGIQVVIFYKLLFSLKIFKYIWQRNTSFSVFVLEQLSHTSHNKILKFRYAYKVLKTFFNGVLPEIDHGSQIPVTS